MSEVSARELDRALKPEVIRQMRVIQIALGTGVLIFLVLVLVLIGFIDGGGDSKPPRNIEAATMLTSVHFAVAAGAWPSTKARHSSASSSSSWPDSAEHSRRGPSIT